VGRDHRLDIALADKTRDSAIPSASYRILFESRGSFERMTGAQKEADAPPS